MNHYVTGNYKARPPTRLSDELYGQVLDAVVKGCVDVLLVHESNVLIAQRNVEPQPGEWFIGGRMFPGETPEEAAVRHVFKDLKLLLQCSSFKYLKTASYVWGRRKQAPQDNGTADVALIFYANLDDAEAKSVHVSNAEEYNGLSWQPLHAAVGNTKYHPALHDALVALRAALSL